MRVTPRQFGQLEVCCHVLEELPEERNRMAKRALNIFQEILDEIRETEEMEEEFEMFNRSDRSDLSDLSDRRDTFDAVRSYGRELIDQGAGIKEVITLCREAFSLTGKDMANMLHIAKSTLTKYMLYDKCRWRIIATFTEFFGTDGKYETEKERE